MRRLAVISLHTSPLDPPGIGDSGGMNIYVNELVRALVRAGVDCDIYVRRTSEDQQPLVEVAPGFIVHHVDVGPWNLPKEQLVDILDDFTDAIEPLVAASGADAIHAHYWLSGVVGHALKHRLNRPLVTTFHTLSKVKELGGESPAPARAAVETAIVGCSDAVLANTATEARELVELYGADPDRVEVVSPGVDHRFFTPGSRSAAREVLGFGPEPLMLFVGRIQRLKGLDLAVETLAASQHQTSRLVVVGGPSGLEGFGALQQAEDRAHELGVADRVRWVKPQPHHRIGAYYRAANVCIVPSRSESFGLVALEAASCGLPVVAADVGGLAEVIDHGSTGFLVRDRKASHYAAFVDQILSDPELAYGLSIKAAARAEDFSWSAAAARLRRLYGDITSSALVTCQ
jgi:D-inositol-3-phosphate glycosyltransferase